MLPPVPPTSQKSSTSARKDPAETGETTDREENAETTADARVATGKIGPGEKRDPEKIDPEGKIDKTADPARIEKIDPEETIDAMTERTASLAKTDHVRTEGTTETMMTGVSAETMTETSIAEIIELTIDAIIETTGRIDPNATTEITTGPTEEITTATEKTALPDSMKRSARKIGKEEHPSSGTRSLTSPPERIDLTSMPR